MGPTFQNFAYLEDILNLYYSSNFDVFSPWMMIWGEEDSGGLIPKPEIKIKALF